jgi:hypothetical protein
MVYIDNHLITLNSKYANQLNGTLLSNVVFGFTGLLQDESNIINTFITVSNAQIPCSFYTITPTNYTIIYTQLGATTSFNIPIGNYNSTSLISALKVGFGANLITLSINKLNGKLSFLFNTNTIIESTSSIKDILGFDVDVPCYTNITSILQFPLNLLGVKKISIKSNSLAITSYSSVNFSTSNTLTTIPVDQPAFNMISYVNQSDLNTNILQARTLNTIDITLVDENNNLLDFNNCDWSITLTLSIHRNENISYNGDLYKSVAQGAYTPGNAQAISDNTNLIDLKVPEKVLEKSQDEKDLELLLK